MRRNGGTPPSPTHPRKRGGRQGSTGRAPSPLAGEGRGGGAGDATPSVRRATQGATLTRRLVLAAALLWPAVGTGAEPLRRVLFIGNSFTHQHGIPSRVAALAAAGGRPLDPHAITRNGATLAGHLADPVVRATLGWGWEAVVLQGFSTTPLHPDRREAAAEAVRVMQRLAPGAQIVMFTAWPRRADHPLYARAADPGSTAPRSPAEMARAGTEHAVALAADLGLSVAPVAEAWVAAMDAGTALHAPDGYHANRAGAALTARVLWQTLSPLLP